jgi:hypothetical protein
MASKKLYSFDDHPEHRDQMPAWRDKWIAHALNTKAMDDADRAGMRTAIAGLYRAANLEPPDRVVFCASPISGAIAASVASGVWWLRENPDAHKKLFGRPLSEADLAQAVRIAVPFVVSRGMYRTLTLEQPPATLPIPPALDQSARAATRAATWAATGDATGAATGDATGAATWDATRAATRAATGAADPVARFLVACCAYWGNYYDGANFWAGYVSYLSFFRHVAQLQLPEYEKFAHYEDAAVHGGPRFMHRKFCIVSDRPEVIRKDDRHRPHCEDGPFLRWRDGWALYAIRGTRVPADVIENPASVTVERINAEQNAEIRRVMLERYGWGRYIEDSGAKELHRDEFGTLYRQELAGDEPLVMVAVDNSTLEPDGTRKRYFLRVHPELRPLRADGTMGNPQTPTAHNAVASTFGMTGDQYHPVLET